MENIIVFPDTLDAARAAGMVATFIETKTSAERGSTYTSARVEVLLNGEQFPRALLIMTRTNGGYDYGQQCARHVMNNLGVNFKGQFDFFAAHSIKSHDHFVETKYAPTMRAAEAMETK